MWKTIGHEEAVKHLSQSLNEGRVSHAYLVTGPHQVGKRTLALDFAKALNCTAIESPCGSCAQCSRVDKSLHPDVRIIGLSSSEGRDRSLISIEQIREVQHEAYLKPYEGVWRVFIFDGAGKLSEEAANSLLKLLEEPPDQVVIFLLAEDYLSLLPTIVSRCQLIKLRPVLPPVISKVLQDVHGTSFELAGTLSGLSNGRPGWAISAFADQEILDETTKALDSTESLLNLSIEERLRYASEIVSRMSAEKDFGRKNLMLWTTWWRAVLFDKQEVSGKGKFGLTLESSSSAASTLSVLQICNAIRSIQRAFYYLERNVNPRLVFEQLMLELPNRR